MRKCIKSVAFRVCLALASMFAVAQLGYASDTDYKKKREELIKDAVECLKASGAFDQQQFDAVADCHKTVTSGDNAAKATKEGWKSLINACLMDKGITLTKAQEGALRGCQQHHPAK